MIIEKIYKHGLKFQEIILEKKNKYGIQQREKGMAPKEITINVEQKEAKKKAALKSLKEMHTYFTIHKRNGRSFIQVGDKFSLGQVSEAVKVFCSQYSRQFEN